MSNRVNKGFGFKVEPNLETVIRMRHDNIVVIFQKFAIISHNPVGYRAFNHFDSCFQTIWSILIGSS